MAKIYYSSMRNQTTSNQYKTSSGAPALSQESGIAVFGYLILLVGIAILLITYIWEYHQVLTFSEQIRQAKIDVQQLHEKNHTLKVEIASLSAHPRIQHLAELKLNLNHPSPYDVVWFENPGDRFKAFEEPAFASATKWLNRFFTINAVEARSPR